MMRVEEIVLNKERDVTLTAYIQKVDGEFIGCHVETIERPAILILPGGGYELCADLEADPVAMPYLKVGYQVFILRYSVGKNKIWPNPLNDYEQAMALIRRKRNDWHANPEKLAVVGFSAGGHLAACAATISENRPNAVILGYPLITDDVQEYSPTAPNVIEHVSTTTCPCFVFTARTDKVVSADNSLQLLSALFKSGVPFESHIYGFGPHGFSTADSSVQEPSDITPRAAHWVEDSLGWLEEIFDKNC